MPSPSSSTARPDSPHLLQPGRNCWRIAHAERFSMLVDADCYFRAVRAAIREARHSVFILSWDIDSRVRLVQSGANDGYPEPLGEFLHAVTAARPELRVYILNWDFAVLYAMEREWLPAYKLGWNGDGRLAFHMDALHPVGASHHQKVVVVDDKLAFVGGLDLTRSRWDTPEHLPQSPLRRDTDGKPYAPFHDVQAMVDGDAARALGELARERWRRATGTLPAVSGSDESGDPWPSSILPDLTDVDVGIARTEPAYNGRSGVAEVRQLHLDAIAAAQRHIYFENQYFTSDLICNALSARLARDDGPEIMIVSPKNQSGWLEQATMGVLRARVHRRLKQNDRHHRYRMYCAELPHTQQSTCLNLHSKVFVVDDDLLSIGSANLSNRSMAFDTECNLVIEAAGSRREELRRGIAQLRNRLLAEHLAVAEETVRMQLHRCGSLHATVDALRQSGRTLAILEPVTTPQLDAMIPQQAIVDPERPIEPDKLLAQFIPRQERRPMPGRMLALGALALTLAALALAWRWTPLGEWVNLESLVTLARSLEALPFTPVVIVCSYVIASFLMVPVMLLIGVTGIVFGPVAGALYAIGGALLSAALTYGVGQWLGRETLHRLLGPRLDQLSRRIARRGIVAIAIVRMLPLAPFTVINLIAGASHIQFRDYLAGTFLGMAPGILVTVTFAHHLAEAIGNPDAGTLAVLAVVAALIIGSAIGLQRLFGKKTNPQYDEAN